MWTKVLLLLLLGFSHAVAKPHNWLTVCPSWNTEMYPLWTDGDPRHSHSWKGGRVIFNVGNDSPTLTGAKVTFTIDLEFPHNQRVTPNGDVVWAKDCLVNGTKYSEAEAVYPGQSSDWDAVFPDGSPMTTDKKPAYVFVWKAWGRYWQVADGPSSSLTIDTAEVQLGSYSMDVVIYHYRSKEKFIPLGYASTQFSITDQIPFAVSLDQVNDVEVGDMHFVRNRAISFTITLHDPSQYLSDADITFNWDFGDASGALISRELTVTHTYVQPGAYKPHVVIQAVLPDQACQPGAGLTTHAPSPHTTASLMGLSVAMDTEEDNAEEEASASMTHSAQDAPPGVNNTRADGSPSTRANKIVKGGDSGTDVVKRNVGVKASTDDCVIYRYGSFCIGIEVSDATEEGEIATMNRAASTEKALDLTVTCLGNLPVQVCSAMLDSTCSIPIHVTCDMAAPSKDCQLVLRHLVDGMGSAPPSSDMIIMALGAMVTVLLAGIIALSYKCLTSQHPSKEATAAGLPSPGRNGSTGSSSLFWWRLLSRKGSVDDCPLLSDGRV
ncbi:melanocyte protein PMEL-like [Synchiropus splendidus]|uniref:melanocyte protein PMEL-like n=1 Tax=Synchiropus splendidus TaxID=270530 RepID=UPI00237EC6D5|nr:melanocyte protein PMEL-like [Synchiropus splendidus]